MTISKSERDDLLRLIKSREKAMNAAAEMRSAELLAQFEKDISTEYSFDQEPVWAAAAKAAQDAVNEAKKIVDKRCAELGIPEGFRPTFSLSWHHRGYNNTLDARRAEVRRAARAEIVALERQARVRIQQISVEAQTKLLTQGLESDQAREFLAKMETIEQLMPKIDAKRITHNQAEQDAAEAAAMEDGE